MKHFSIGLALFALGCMGGRLEYASAEEASDATPAPDDGGAEAAVAEPAPEAPAWLDPAVLDTVATDATELGLSPERPGEQTLYAPLSVSFANNSATLLPESTPALEAARRLPRGRAACDRDPRRRAQRPPRERAEYNLRLTAARALAVARWLVDHGIACARVEAVGYGEDRPLSDNVTAGGWARNRRVELWVIGVDGSTRVDGGGMVMGSPCDPGADPNALLHPDGKVSRERAVA